MSNYSVHLVQERDLSTVNQQTEASPLIRATARWLSTSIRYSQYRPFLKKLRPIELHSVRVGNVEDEAGFDEYSRLLDDHPLSGQLNPRTRKRLLEGALRFDRFMHIPGVYT